MDAEFFVFLAFVCFVGALIVLGLPRLILGRLDAHAKAVADEFAQAHTLRLEAEALLANVSAMKAEAERQAADILAQSRAEAERLSQETALEMEAFLSRRTKEAEAKIALAERRAAQDIRDAAVDRAVDLAAVLLKQASSGEQGIDLNSREIPMIGASFSA